MPQFLYLTTKGWKTAKQHTIEIWFIEYNNKYYILSYHKKHAHWVQNILKEPKVSIVVSNITFDGYARAIDNTELELIADISSLMNKNMAGVMD